MTEKDRSKRSNPTTELHTVTDVADRLKVSEKTVRRLIKSRELEAYQIRRQWRVSEADLIIYLARQRWN